MIYYRVYHRILNPVRSAHLSWRWCIAIDCPRVPAYLAIISPNSLRESDRNKLFRVINQEQIMLIRAYVAQTGHDWVIRHPERFFITVINVSASAVGEGSHWWMEEHSPAFPISHLPLGIIQTNCPIFWCRFIFIVTVPRWHFWGGTKNQLLVDELEIIYIQPTQTAFYYL